MESMKNNYYSGLNIGVSINRYVEHRIKERRSSLKMTQNELANSIGLTYQQIQKYEKGSCNISLENLYKISLILDTSIEYFLSEYSTQRYDAVSDNKAINYETELSKQTAVITKLFRNIKNEKVRLKIIELIKAISQNLKEIE